MEESLGAQYAMQIAVHTLRDRCKSLQQRIAQLEDENVGLRVRCNRHESNESSLSEMDKLKEQITHLSEHRDQLQDKIRMVTAENQDLWSKLGKLINVNKNLGEQLKKINDTVTQHTTPQHATLIRSKTFTQDQPQTKVLQKNLEMNEKISLELETVSLKLMDSFSKQKMELEEICSEIDKMQESEEAVINEDCGFYFDEEIENDMVSEFKYLVDDLAVLKEHALQQQKVLEENLRNLETIKDSNACQICDNRQTSLQDKSTSTVDIPKNIVDRATEIQHFTLEESGKQTKSSPDYDQVCPFCTKLFGKHIEFSIFQQHVEEHFTPDVTSYEML
nr:unnamed protein product [Callosobruchus analis]